MKNPSFTEKMLDLCLEGMGDIELHKFYPHKMQIGPCSGCMTCWKKDRAGVCVQKDDFAQIHAVYQRADFVFWAAPLYFFGLPAWVKNVMDRFFIDIDAPMHARPDGVTTHPRRLQRDPKMVLVSSAGFPEMEHFDALRLQFKMVSKAAGWPLAGELLISAAGMNNAPKLFDGKYALLRKAGEELARDGRVADSTMAGISADVISADDYRKIANVHLKGGMGAVVAAFPAFARMMLGGGKG
jgi:multimeric flavodoxin WrbA